MSLHKLSAGHGYDSLIRQVAAHDATHRGRTDLATYYEGRGETPGRWVGRGLVGVDGLEVVMSSPAIRCCCCSPRAAIHWPARHLEISMDQARHSGCRSGRVAGSSRSWRRCGAGSAPTTPCWGCPPMWLCRRRRGRGSAASWPRTGSSKSTAVPPRDQLEL